LRRGLLGGAAVAGLAPLGAVAPLGVAHAQLAVEEIVVTARKREESLQEIPIAITAFSAVQLEQAGFKDLHELSKNVAGLQYHSLGLAIPGRVNSSIRFRGMDVNSQSPTFQLATLFIDGIYVLGNTESIPFDDVERVEVVKGPQAAYFGRNTFGGAINYITKTPSTSDFSGQINVSAATYDEYNVTASVEGPLVADKIGVRLGGRFYSKGNMFTASDGGGLGEEESQSGQASVYLTPTDAFNVRARVFVARDSDGAPAGGYIAGRLNDTCTGKTITTKAGQSVQPIRFICGIVPKQGTALNVFGGRKIIDSNTTIRPAQAFISSGDPDFLIKNLIKKPHPALLSGLPELDRIGLERRMFRGSGQAEYTFANKITATLAGGYNTQEASWARDYTFTPRENAYSRDPQDLEDFSIDARLASAQDQKLRWLGGVNYYEQDLITSGTGGDSVYLCNDTVPGLPFGDCRRDPNPAFNTTIFNNALASTDHVETLGIYGAVTYDVTDQLSLNLEGRWQKDEFTRGTVVRTTATFKTFLPRVILQYKPTPETNLYASFAKGVIPGEINQAYIDNSDFAKRQFDAAGVVPFLPEELLDSYEIGWKQQLFDNRLAFNLAGYYGEWVNKKSRIVVSVQYICGDPQSANGSAGCRPNLGEAGPGQPARNPDGSPLLRTTNVVVAGDSKIWGFEFEGNAALAEGWDTGWTLGYAGNKFTNFTANFIQPYARFTNVKGNAHARFPKWSWSVNSTYTAELTDAWEWFVRGDLSFFGKTFVDVDNLAQCDSYYIANARTGVEKEGFRLELFVKNMLDDDNWAACTRFSEFDLPLDLNFLTQYQGVIVAPQNKRQFGLRTAITF
jgi:iron complex outermembrane receptor protein